MQARIEDGKLIIEVELEGPPFRPSASGKTLIIASSHGNQPTQETVDGQAIRIGLNAYIYPPRS